MSDHVERERAIFVDLSHQTLNNISRYPHRYWINFSQSYNFNHIYKKHVGEIPLALWDAFHILYKSPPHTLVMHMNVSLTQIFSLSHLKAKYCRQVQNVSYNWWEFSVCSFACCFKWLHNLYWLKLTIDRPLWKENSFVTVCMKVCVHVLINWVISDPQTLTWMLCGLLIIKEKELKLYLL